MIVNVLTVKNFFFDHCSYGFVFPLFKSKKSFLEKKITFNFFKDFKNSFYECDIALIDGRYYLNLDLEKRPFFLEKIQKLKKSNNKIIFVDTADNAGQIKPEVFPFFDKFWKSQILKNKSEYLKKHYGGRKFTDFYKEKFHVIDDKPEYSSPIKKEDLNKIDISWNMGMVPYSNYSHLSQKIFSIFPLTLFLFNKISFTNPNSLRKKNLSCRIGTKYLRNTVSFQRNKIIQIIKKEINFKKIKRRKYLKELENSKFALSPFGWGEICPRDFEIFSKGAILVKPDMDSIKTWPNWYEKDITYLPFKWDFTDFEKILEYSMDNYDNLVNIAINAQDKYKKYVQEKDSAERFVNHFIKLI